MPTWLLKSIGADAAFHEHRAEIVVAVQRPAVFAMVVAILIPVGWYVVRRQRRNLASVPNRVRNLLNVTRCAILALLLSVLAGPMLKLDFVLEQKPIVALLVDVSQSMRLPAGPFSSNAERDRMLVASGLCESSASPTPDEREAIDRMPRHELVASVLANQASVSLKALMQRFDVTINAVADQIVPIPLDRQTGRLSEIPNADGASTHLGDAIVSVLDQAGSRTVGGIVLLSDGRNTGGRSLSESAAAASNSGAPVFAVPAGSSARQRDVAITDVFTSGLVSVGDTARVAVTIESDGFDGRLVGIDLNDGQTQLDHKEINLRTGEQQTLDLTFRALEAGVRHLVVRVTPLAEEPETLHGNNTQSAVLRVSAEKSRVLYVEGMPRWDFRFLRNAMRRDRGLAGRESQEPDIVLEAEAQRHAGPLTEALPHRPEILSDYHTVILGDATPRLLTSAFLNALARAVKDKGVGLIIAAGPMAMPHQFGEPITSLMPVRIDPRVSGLEAPTFRPFRVQLGPEGIVHEMTRLFDDPQKNQSVWSQMPFFYWCAATTRLAPAASSLMVNAGAMTDYGKAPLIAYHYAGAGKVLFVGMDSTFTWRQNAGDRYFYRFWGQTIRFVARRDIPERTSWLEVRPLRARIGEYAHLELMAYTATGMPLDSAVVMVDASSADSIAAIPLAADPQVPGRYTGSWKVTSVGEVRFQYGAADSATAEARIFAAPDDAEFRRPDVDRMALEALSHQTSGRIVELPDLNTIPEIIQGEPTNVRIYREATLWDNWLVLALLVTLYSLDVAIRRLTGLS